MSCVSVGTQRERNCLPVSQALSPTTALGRLNLTKEVSKYPSQSYPGAVSDFYGLSSNPIWSTDSVDSDGVGSGDEWLPQGPEAQRVPVLRGARPVFNHPLQDVWPTLHIEVYEFLDTVGVIWSTIDPIRFAEEGKEAGPLYLWIGIVPKSLSFEDAQAAAIGCKKTLANANFSDIEIAFRESLYIRSSGPQLLKHNPSVDPNADIQYPFTPSLGIQIATRDTPHFEGFRESNDSKRVFLLTARHVILHPTHSTSSNQLYSCKKSNQRRVDVVILGSQAYNDALEGMMVKIWNESIFVGIYQRELDNLGEAVKGETSRRTRARKDYQAKLADAIQMISDVNDFHSDITKHWSIPRERIIGCVLLHAPPISLTTGPKQFMEDWALIDLDLDKINWDIQG
jgi:hypothetical protein